MISEFLLARLASLVRHVAGVAAHVERRMPAAFFRHLYTFVVTGQAETVGLIAGSGFQQLVLIGGAVRAVGGVSRESWARGAGGVTTKGSAHPGECRDPCTKARG